ncbi:MarR family transcriptional regulator [Lentzea sp. NBRC 102530]|uniref:MarR family winged helix-turn-helix transcriptional regulator n=1 Tax=Lentzea sp. NBRC 102530 TaxID=3032201 RepID=UPI0024A5B479|nr:MarR family transcriptional regulator [Lentzea sp. NBRC 102530]GLY50825.1 MarR family transcriptional regulator [Lentzea sp. NBRC 102530]
MPETRWLDEEEARTWRSFMLAFLLLQSRLERELKRDANLSFAHYDVLSRLSEAPGRSMRMADLASDAVFDRSRLCHTIDRLARKGWVRRVRCETDRRGQLAELTDEGVEVVRRAAPRHAEEVLKLVFDRLAPGQHEALREISEKLALGLERPGNDVPPGHAAHR